MIVCTAVGIEAHIRGDPPDKRKSVRQEHAALLIDDLEEWLHAQLTQTSGKSALAGAIRYGLTRLIRLRPYLDDGRLSIDNNAAERGMRSIPLGRKNYLLWVRTRAAIAYTLIETAKLNDALSQQILDISKAERKPKIQPDGMLDDLDLKTVTSIAEIVHRRYAFALLTVIVSLLALSPLVMGHFDLEFPEPAEAC